MVRHNIKTMKGIPTIMKIKNFVIAVSTIPIIYNVIRMKNSEARCLLYKK